MDRRSDIKIRYYKPQDHEVVNQIFDFGIMEHVRHAIWIGINGSKPGMVAKFLAIFAIATWLTSSILIGTLIGIIFGSIYAWFVWYFFKEYVQFHLRTDMKDPELKYWTNPPNGFIVATKKSTDEIIGCVSYQKISESTVELNRLSVQSDARGLGIGQKLVQAVIKDAKDQGYKNVYLETSDAQIGAWQLYEKLGFIKLMKENSPVDNWTFIHGVIVFAYNYEI